MRAGLSTQTCKEFLILRAGLLRPSPQTGEGEGKFIRRGECISLVPVLRIPAVKHCHKDMDSHIGPRWKMEKEVSTEWT